jgi:hypothetical protein
MPPNVTPYYGAPPDSHAPAKRASVLMFILGPIILLLGGCFAAMPSMLAMAPPDQARQMYDQFQNTYHVSASEINVVFVVIGVVVLLVGLALLIMALFVRRGGKVATILAMVVTGLILLNSAGGLLLALLHMTDASALGGLCTNTFVLAIFGLLFVWLTQAFRASGKIRHAQQQYQAQYWQYQQNMQAYMHAQQQGGYPNQGYAQAGPPPVPPPQTQLPQIPEPPPGDPNTPPPVG